MLPKELSENEIKYREYPYLVYARVSSDKDSQKESVANQIDICRYWLEQNHYEWNEHSILKDEDISGTEFLKRAAMQLILKKARNREIKMVIFKSIHRLARDLKDSLEIKEVLLGHGVRVVTIEEGYDSLVEGKNDMKFEMHAMFAAQYPKTLSISISSALAAKVRRGEHIGKIPFGYNRVDQKLVINEGEASVIRQIFKWYNKGFGFKSITHMLNDGVKTGEILKPRMNNVWQMTTVQRIIQNPIYCGTFILNKYTTIKIDGRKKQIKNPEDKWLIFENQHPAIITKEEWQTANNKPVINKKKKISPWNEFRGVMKCGQCGSNMVILQSWNKKKDGSKTRWRYLKCSAYRRGGTNLCMNHPPILYENFREFMVNTLIEKGKKIAVDFESTYGKHKIKEIKELEKTQKELEKRKESLLEVYLDQIISKIEFEQKRFEIENHMKRIDDKLFLYNKEETNQIEIKDIKDAFRKIEDRNMDIYQAVNVLIDTIVINMDGTTDIKFKFDFE